MDALAALVTLLKPQTIGAKIIHGAGRWGVSYPAFGQPSFALVVKGSCQLAVEGKRPITLAAGDFVFFPAMPGFTMASGPGVEPRSVQAATGTQLDEIFHGRRRTRPDVTLVGGYFAFDPLNAALLLDFLPHLLRIRTANSTGANLVSVIALIQSEVREQRPGRALVLTRLIEILLVEALRAAPARQTPTGFLAGLRDPQVAQALRAMHTEPAHPWTLAMLARSAGLSRSVFAERFARVMRTTPVNYLLQVRLGLAKSLLIHDQATVAEAAHAVGYEAASAFSTAFRRETGYSPRAFAQAHAIKAR